MDSRIIKKGGMGIAPRAKEHQSSELKDFPGN